MDSFAVSQKNVEHLYLNLIKRHTLLKFIPEIFTTVNSENFKDGEYLSFANFAKYCFEENNSNITNFVIIGRFIETERRKQLTVIGVKLAEKFLENEKVGLLSIAGELKRLTDEILKTQLEVQF